MQVFPLYGRFNDRSCRIAKLRIAKDRADTPENQARFPQQHNQKPGIGFPITRIVALISLGASTILDYALGPYQGKGTGETLAVSTLLDRLKLGDRLLVDRTYCTYAIVALLIQRQAWMYCFKTMPEEKPGCTARENRTARISASGRNYRESRFGDRKNKLWH